MKCGVILFHSGIDLLYRPEWIRQCVDSLLNQTRPADCYLEINYSGESKSVLEGISGIDHYFYSEALPTYAHAMNFLLDKAVEIGCDCVFNSNLDDYYATTRFAKQLDEIEAGYDLVSSNFVHIDENNCIMRNMQFSSLTDIRQNFDRNHNVIAHPVVCYSKKFLNTYRYDTSKVPAEDFDLWKRAISDGAKFVILDDTLLFYRRHLNQVGAKNLK
jgi:hypothetical protein